MSRNQTSALPPANLPELLERDAPASVRSIYDGLRRGAATPIAALIWRHIATHPGVLEACWASLGPLFDDGRLQDAAWRVARETTPRRLLPKVDPNARPLLGISPDDAASIQTLVEAYNRANPVNMLGVKVLLARIDSAAPIEPMPAAEPWSPPPAERPAGRGYQSDRSRRAEPVSSPDRMARLSGGSACRAGAAVP